MQEMYLLTEPSSYDSNDGRLLLRATTQDLGIQL